MKRLMAVGLVLGTVVGAFGTQSLVPAGASTSIRPYHQESSITATRTSYG